MHLHGTTILCGRTNGKVVIGGDGQVSMGNQVVKATANKIRKIGNTVVGFAGSTADAISMFEMLENRLSKSQELLEKVCTDLTKSWRARHSQMEALLLVADSRITLLVTGYGDVIEPEHPAIGIGSGGTFALSAAMALLPIENLTALEVVQRAMRIAGDICTHTNHSLVTEEIDCA